MVAVGRVRVAVELTLEVRQLDEPRKLALRGGFNLPRVLPKLRWEPRETHRGVDLFFGGTGDTLAARLLEDTVLRDLQPPLDRHLADSDIVLLRAGEVGERRAETFGL